MGLPNPLGLVGAISTRFPFPLNIPPPSSIHLAPAERLTEGPGSRSAPQALRISVQSPSDPFANLYYGFHLW